jgi:hypothetical protein
VDSCGTSFFGTSCNSGVVVSIPREGIDSLHSRTVRQAAGVVPKGHNTQQHTNCGQNTTAVSIEHRAKLCYRILAVTVSNLSLITDYRHSGFLVVFLSPKTVE